VCEAIEAAAWDWKQNFNRVKCWRRSDGYDETTAYNPSG